MARPIPLLPPLTNATLPSKPTAPPPRFGGTIGARLKGGPEPSGPARRPGGPAEAAVPAPEARGSRRPRWCRCSGPAAKRPESRPPNPIPRSSPAGPPRRRRRSPRPRPARPRAGQGRPRRPAPAARRCRPRATPRLPASPQRRRHRRAGSHAPERRARPARPARFRRRPRFGLWSPPQPASQRRRRGGDGAGAGDRRYGPPPTPSPRSRPARRALDRAPPGQLPIPGWHPSRPAPPVGQTDAVGDADSALAGRAIGITADRRWEEQADLFRRRGATIVHGPTMATRLLHEDQELRAVTEDLVARPPAYLAATTGIGIRTWMKAARVWDLEQPLLAALSGARIVARGPKAAGAVDEAGLAVWARARSERMEDVAAVLLAEALDGVRVAVQPYGVDAPALRS